MTPTYRLLVVEDDPAVARTLARRLESHGYEVLTAPDGREGMKSIVEHEPDLVISDWMMPHVDGLELCRAVKTGLGSVAPYFVLLTAHDDLNARLIAIETGADDFLVKPCHEAELAARVRSGLRQVTLRAEIKRLTAELERANAALQLGAPRAGAACLIPLCPECQRVEGPDGEWQELAAFVAVAGLVSFEGRPCPICSDPRSNGLDEHSSRAA